MRQPASESPSQPRKPTPERPTARFWEVGRGPTTAHEFAVLAAMTIAMSARNWVEDLHAAGSFSDAQAPALNRRLRNRAYEVLMALEHFDRDRSDALAGFLASRAELDEQTDHDVEPIAALRGAIRKAVRDFARVEQLPASAAERLEEAAVAGATDAYRRLQTINEQTSAMQISYLASMVPRYWEVPTIDPRLKGLFVSGRLTDASAVASRPDG